MRILVVEDDPEISRFLVRGLTEERHSVVLRTDGHHVAELAVADEFDARHHAARP
jgi:DNA-binding response OmpR family regulator